MLSDTSSRRVCITVGGNFPRIKTYSVWSDSDARELSFKARWTGNERDFYAPWQGFHCQSENSPTVVRTPVGLAQHGFDLLDACGFCTLPALLTNCNALLPRSLRDRGKGAQIPPRALDDPWLLHDGIVKEFGTWDRDFLDHLRFS